MRLRPFMPETDFNAMRDWIADERAHALWCAGRFAYPLEREDFGRVLRDLGARCGDRPFVMADSEGRAAGFFCFSPNEAAREGKMKFVVVDPALRGQGLGKAMLKLAVEYAFSAAGAEAVRLSVFAENIPALKCYESVGFAVTRTDAGAFRFRNESWNRCQMVIRKDNDRQG